MAHNIGFPHTTENPTQEARPRRALVALLRRIGRRKLHSRFPDRIWRRHSALLNAAGCAR